MNEVLVTGATGFVGPHLVAALRARGARVRVLATPQEDASGLEREHGVVVHRGDVRIPETLAPALRDVDTVFHLAGIHGLWRPRKDYEDVNVLGTENVCRAALAAGVRRVLHVSTWVAYGMALGRLIDERLPLRPIDDPYTISKARGDEIVQRFIARDGLPATIVRPAVLFGPGDRVNFARMADRVRTGRAVVIGSGENALPFLYVTDAVEGFILAATTEHALGQAYNLAHDEPITQLGMWRAIAEELGVAPPRLHVPYAPLHAVAFLAERAVALIRSQRQPLVTRLGVKLFGADNRISSERAHRELEWTARVPIREGVRRAARWYLGTSRAPGEAPPAATALGG